MDVLDNDFLLALELQEQLDKESWKPSTVTSDKLSIVDESWETIDPNPDIRELFLQYNTDFFWGKLSGIEVKWSPRMTLCAGLCVYEGRGGLCSVRLSLPLLKLRPRKDLVETLLHEMIHAYLFVTDNNKDHDGHGPEFHKHMYRLNNATGTNISVYHNFHDEVDHFRQHWWRCDGPCQSRKPFFGYVKRAMNRAPSARDPWWKDHKRTCDGTFIKIKEPEGYGKKKSKDKNEKPTELEKPVKKGNPDIRSFLGKSQALGSTNQKVIVNGILKCKDMKDFDNKVICLNDDKPSCSKESPRKSVSAINTTGKISDNELLRQKRLTELLLSDSDDEDLLLCDGPPYCSNSNATKSPKLENNIGKESSSCDNEVYPCTEISDSPKKTYTSSFCQSKMNSTASKQVLDVAAKVRNVWANKQFRPTLKPLDTKGNQIVIQGSSQGHSTSSSQGHSTGRSQGHSTGSSQGYSTGSSQEQISKKRLSSGGSTSSRKKLKTNSAISGSQQSTKINDMFLKNNVTSIPSCDIAECPVCSKSVPKVEINQHLDTCLGIS